MQRYLVHQKPRREFSCAQEACGPERDRIGRRCPTALAVIQVRLIGNGLTISRLKNFVYEVASKVAGESESELTSPGFRVESRCSCASLSTFSL